MRSMTAAAPCARSLPPSNRTPSPLGGRRRRTRAAEPPARGRTPARPSLRRARIAEVREGRAALARALPDRELAEAPALRGDHGGACEARAGGGRTELATGLDAVVRGLGGLRQGRDQPQVTGQERLAGAQRSIGAFPTSHCYRCSPPPSPPRGRGAVHRRDSRRRAGARQLPADRGAGARGGRAELARKLTFATPLVGWVGESLRTKLGCARIVRRDGSKVIPVGPDSCRALATGCRSRSPI